MEKLNTTDPIIFTPSLIHTHTKREIKKRDLKSDDQIFLGVNIKVIKFVKLVVENEDEPGLEVEIGRRRLRLVGKGVGREVLLLDELF